MGRKKAFDNRRKKAQAKKHTRVYRMNKNATQKGPTDHEQNIPESTLTQGDQSVDEACDKTIKLPKQTSISDYNSPSTDRTLKVTSAKRAISPECIQHNKKSNISAEKDIQYLENHDTNRIENGSNDVIPHAVKRCANRFYKKVKEGPIYCCVSCQRMLFRNSVLMFKTEKYDNDSSDTIQRLLSSAIANAHEGNGHLWVCHTCHKTLKQSKQPVQCKLNNLSLDPVPEELMDLKPLEQRLISQRIVFMKLVALPKGGQKSIQGPAVQPSMYLQSSITYVLFYRDFQAHYTLCPSNLSEN